MQIGYFTSPHSKSILVVMDYEKWTPKVLEQGFPASPVLVREATTPEIEALRERTGFPAWLYTSFDRLLDDEVKSGAPRPHLEELLRITLRVLDNYPQPKESLAS